MNTVIETERGSVPVEVYDYFSFWEHYDKLYYSPTILTEQVVRLVSLFHEAYTNFTADLFIEAEESQYENSIHVKSLLTVKTPDGVERIENWSSHIKPASNNAPEFNAKIKSAMKTLHDLVLANRERIELEELRTKVAKLEGERDALQGIINESDDIINNMRNTLIDVFTINESGGPGSRRKVKDMINSILN